MQPKFMYCAVMLTILFASMAFAEPSGPPGGDGQNGTDHNGPMNYANVTVSLIADYDAHYCALDVNFSSSQLNIDKLINITGGMPNASISEDTKQFLMMLNRSLAESGGSFTCALFSNGSGGGNQDGGGSQDSGQQEHPPIDPNGTAKCNGNPAPAQLISGIAHLLEKGSPDAKPDPNVSSMLSPLCPFGLPYANVTVNLILDNDTRSCFLGINYISREESFDKRLNITSTVPSPEVGRRQAILVLNSSLAAANGSFKCVIFSNGSAECRGKEGNTVPFPALALRDAGIGKGLNDSSLPGPNDTNGLSVLCPYSNESNATHDDGIYHPHPNESTSTNYANVTLRFTIDSNARSCFLDIDYVPSQLSTAKHINVTGSVPGSNTASSFGPFKCLLFNDSSAECHGPGNAASPIYIASFSDPFDIAQQLGTSSAGYSGSESNISAILAGMCPYGANGSSSLGNTTSGGGAGTNAGQQGNITITHGNITGQGGAVYANNSNATGQANATFNNSAVGTAAAATREAAAGLIMFATSHATATAVVFVAVVAVLAYALLKSGMLSLSARK